MKRLRTSLFAILTALALLAGAAAEGLYPDELGYGDSPWAEPVEDAVPEAEAFDLGGDLPFNEPEEDRAVAAGEGDSGETIDDEVVYDLTINEDGWLVGYDGEDTEVVVPEGVVGIGSYAFRYNNTIESIVLPEGLTRISSSAFTDMGKLSRINIPSTVTRIDDSAFYCSQITEIVIPDSVEVLGRSVFKHCSQLKSVKLPAGITVIPWDFFAGCTSLTSFEIPNTVTEIQGSAFSGSGLKSIVIPDSVTKVGMYCFNSCKDLQSVTIPGSIVEWGSDYSSDNRVFDACTHLTEVNLGEGINSIGYGMFSNCTALTSITLPSTITSIETHAFRSCSSLTDIYLTGDNLVTIPRPDDLFVASEVPSIKDIVFHTHCDTTTTQTLKKRGYTVSKTAHTPVDNEDVPATCLEAGSRGGTHCSVCNAVITPAEYLPPTGHKPVKDPAIASTYTTTGLTEGVHCANCGAVITPQQVVPMLEMPENPSSDPSQDQPSQDQPSQDQPSQDQPSQEPVVPTGIALNQAGTVTLENGKALQLRAIVNPYNADTTLSWSSGNPDVAVVDRTGRVIAVGAGTSVVTVATDNGLTASVTINVPAQEPDPADPAPTDSTVVPTPSSDPAEPAAIEPTKVALNKKKTTTLKVSKTLALKATLTPAGAASALTWSSSNKKIAKVSENGKVTALKAGTATITVATANGKTATVKIKVTADKPKSVSLNKKALTLKKGKTAQLKASFTPKTADSTLTWSTSNKKVATVTKAGKVKAVGKGTAIITVRTKNGKTATVKITVK